MTSKEARQLLLERISTDKEFYRSLKGKDKGEEEENNGQDDGDERDGGDDRTVYYDETDSSKTVGEAVADVIKCTPAESLGAIYADEDSGSSSESDTEDRGVGANLDMYTGEKFSSQDTPGGWMEWNSK